MDSGNEIVRQAATKFAGHAGVIHFNCLSDAEGLVLRWQTDVTAIAEPSSMALSFLDKVKRHDESFASLDELCSVLPSVEVDGVLHTFLGKHQQTNNSGEQVQI